MSTPAWQPGRLYPPGSLVVPRTQQPAGQIQIPNGDMEAGDQDWNLTPLSGATLAIVNEPGFTGAWVMRHTGSAENQDSGALTEALYPVVAGQQITARAMFRLAQGSPGSSGLVALYWYDSGGNLIGQPVLGTELRRSQGTGWRQSTVTASAPGAAVNVRAALHFNSATGTTLIYADDVSWNYASPIQSGLQYRAVQPAIGHSDTVEPAWPGILGQTVVDNEVIWEAVSISRVVWEARALLKSGGTEPDWPTSAGARVADGTISWEAISRRVEDENCPSTKVTAIMSSKVFKADRDIVRFSATANPLDWTSIEDAGYLPTGLQQANANDMAVMHPYRSNLAAFNASSFQNWQVDPDPQLMAILDQMDGVGSTWQKAAQPVGDELFYLSQLGVRTVGIANAAENLAAGDVGMPIDPLVQAAISAAVASGAEPISTYYPSAGQYWLAFPGYPEGDPPIDQTTVFVYSMTRVGKVGAWSRYVFPFTVESFAQLGNDLYVRHGDTISRVSEDVATDELPDGMGTIEQPFPGVVWWPWLDFGTPGATKMLEGFDYVGNGQGPSISIGYDQRNLSALTPPYQLENDTMPGGIIPLPVSAPTLSVRLDFAGGERWQVQSVLLSTHQLGGGP